MPHHEGCTRMPEWARGSTMSVCTLPGSIYEDQTFLVFPSRAAYTPQRGEAKSDSVYIYLCCKRIVRRLLLHRALGAAGAAGCQAGGGVMKGDVSSPA